MQMLSSAGDLATFGDSSSDPITAEILSYIMNIMFSQLSFLVQSPAYKWHLKFAPTYTALTIAFTCKFGYFVSPNKTFGWLICTQVFSY